MAGKRRDIPALRRATSAMRLSQGSAFTSKCKSGFIQIIEAYLTYRLPIIAGSGTSLNKKIKGFCLIFGHYLPIPRISHCAPDPQTEGAGMTPDTTWWLSATDCALAERLGTKPAMIPATARERIEARTMSFISSNPFDD